MASAAAPPTGLDASPAGDASPRLDASTVGGLIRALAPEAERLGLAVSGGGDSMALLALVTEWRASDDRAPDIVVLTFDHALRPEAAAEHAMVREAAASTGVAWRLARWAAPEPGRGDLMARARAARRAAFAEWAVAERVEAIALAHTQDDVFETFLMRLARGSGLDGLSRMAACAPLPTPPGARPASLIRPLLDWPRAALRDVLRRRGLAWVEDPTNDDPRFARARVRAATDALEALGLTRRRVAAAAAALHASRAALETAVEHAWSRSATAFPDLCAVQLDHAALRAHAPEMAARLVARALRTVAGPGPPPRRAALDRVVAALRADAPFAARTLGGAAVSVAADVAVFAREPARAEAARVLAPGVWTLWDGRFWARAAEGPAVVGALGAVSPKSVGTAAARSGAALDRATFERWRAAPPSVRAATPVVRAGPGGAIRAAPGLGWAAPGVDLAPAGGFS